MREGIATYVGPSGGKTTQPVLDWMSPPQTIEAAGETRTLVMVWHEQTHPILAAMHDEIADAVTLDAQQARVRAQHVRRAS